VQIKLMASLLAGAKCRAVKLTIDDAVIGIARSHNAARAFLSSERDRIKDADRYRRVQEQLRIVLESKKASGLVHGDSGDTSFASFLVGDRRGIAGYLSAVAMHESNKRMNKLPSPPRYNR
jgi:hypothetical protein